MRTALLGVARDAAPFLPAALEQLDAFDRDVLGGSARSIFHEDGSTDSTRALLQHHIAQSGWRRWLLDICCTHRSMLPAARTSDLPDDCGGARHRAARIALARNRVLDALRRGKGGVPASLWPELDIVVWIDLDDRPGRVIHLPLLLEAVRSGRAQAAFPGSALPDERARDVGHVRRAYDTWALRPLGGLDPPRGQRFWSCDPRDLRKSHAFFALESAARAAARRFAAGWAGLENTTIEVASAFNGIGVYRAAALGSCRYEPDGDCEHVSFHRCIARGGARLAIVPAVSVVRWRAATAALPALPTVPSKRPPLPSAVAAHRRPDPKRGHAQGARRTSRAKHG